MEESTINQRINLLVQVLDEGNKLAFSKRVGMSNQGLGEIIGERQSTPSFPKLEKMLRALPQVRIEWLLLGEGEMLKPTPKAEDPQKKMLYNPADLFPDGISIAKEPATPSGLRIGEVVEVHGQVIQTFSEPGKGAPKPAPPQLPGLDFIETVAAHGAQLEKLRQELHALREQVEKR